MRALGELTGPEYMARMKESDREWEGLQAQRAEFFLGQLAGEVALQLVAELRSALAHEAAVEVGVAVHRAALDQ